VAKILRCNQKNRTWDNRMADVNSIFKQLESLSLFELNRLRSAISIALEDPDKNQSIKNHLKVGMKITYFSSNKNSLIEATVVDIRKTRASVVNADDGVKWNISFYLINLQGIDVNIVPKRSFGGLDRNSLKVGDHVGWHSKLGYELYGVIEKLNPKKALIHLGDGQQWTVSYPLLFLVMDGVSIQSRSLCIEGEVIR
jgi:hypothetical protein